MTYKYTPRLPALTYALQSEVKKGVTYKPMSTEVGGGSGEVVTSIAGNLKAITLSADLLESDSLNIIPVSDEWITRSSESASSEKLCWNVNSCANECLINVRAIDSIADLMLTKVYSKEQFFKALGHMLANKKRASELVILLSKLLKDDDSKEKSLIVVYLAGMRQELENIEENIREVEKKDFSK